MKMEALVLGGKVAQDVAFGLRDTSVYAFIGFHYGIHYTPQKMHGSSELYGPPELVVPVAETTSKAFAQFLLAQVEKSVAAVSCASLPNIMGSSFEFKEKDTKLLNERYLRSSRCEGYHVDVFSYAKALMEEGPASLAGAISSESFGCSFPPDADLAHPVPQSITAFTGSRTEPDNEVQLIRTKVLRR